jgi:arylsulfatase
VELAGAHHPDSFQGQKILPLEGISLLPIFQGKERARPTPLCWEHEGNRAVRLGKWKLVSRYRKAWELYDMELDRTESNNLAGQHPDQVQDMAALYEGWAKRCKVLPPDQLPPPPSRPFPQIGRQCPRSFSWPTPSQRYSNSHFGLASEG